MLNKNIKDITGRRYGRLVVIEYVESVNRITRWRCCCDCGNELVVWRTSLVGEGTTSCGCYKKEIDSINLSSVTHGMTGSITYNSYTNMKKRCINSKHHEYHLYGGRGIQICERWLNSFENFLEDMGERPSSDYVLDRKDPDGNYEPSNCRWLTQKESANNRRNTIFITFNNETKSLDGWASSLGIKRTTLWNRIKVLGWSIEQALTTPVK